MDAEFELSTVDFRTTPVENIFLDTYLAEAPAEALRVYLAGWKLCYSKRESETETMTLSDFLGMSAEAIREAMAYWEERNLVEAAPDRRDAWRFRSMLLAWAGIYDRQVGVDPSSSVSESTNVWVPVKESGEVSSASSPSQSSEVPLGQSASENLENPEAEFSAMFDALEDFLSAGFSYHVTLKPNEILLISDLIARYGFTPDYFLYAYQKAHAQSESSARSVNYLAAIVENWARFEGITDREALDAFLSRDAQTKKNTKRKKRSRRKKSEYAAHDTRMSRSEEQEWIRQKLEASRRLSLPENFEEEEEE